MLLIYAYIDSSNNITAITDRPDTMPPPTPPAGCTLKTLTAAQLQPPQSGARPGSIDANGNVVWILPPAPAPRQTVLNRIDQLEKSVTPRMIREALTGATTTGLGADRSMTAAHYINSIQQQIVALRAQLTS